MSSKLSNRLNVINKNDSDDLGAEQRLPCTMRQYGSKKSSVAPVGGLVVIFTRHVGAPRRFPGLSDEARLFYKLLGVGQRFY